MLSAFALCYSNLREKYMKDKIIDYVIIMYYMLQTKTIALTAIVSFNINFNLVFVHLRYYITPKTSLSFLVLFQYL